MYYVTKPIPETDRPITLWRGIDTIKIGLVYAGTQTLQTY